MADGTVGRVAHVDNLSYTRPPEADVICLSVLPSSGLTKARFRVKVNLNPKRLILDATSLPDDWTGLVLGGSLEHNLHCTRCRPDLNRAMPMHAL